MLIIYLFQAMFIVAWDSGSLSGFLDEDVFRSVLSVFITSAFLNFLQGKILLTTGMFERTIPAYAHTTALIFVSSIQKR